MLCEHQYIRSSRMLGYYNIVQLKLHGINTDTLHNRTITHEVEIFIYDFLCRFNTDSENVSVNRLPLEWEGLRPLLSGNMKPQNN